MTERLSADSIFDTSLDELAYYGHACTVGVLAAALAHQMSQPLTASLVSIDAARRLIGDSRPDVSEALLDVVVGHERLSSIVRTFRNQWRVTPRQRERFDVNAVARDVGRMVERQVAHRRIRVTLSLSPETRTIVGNRLDLQELVLHLLTNACDAVQDCDDARREVIVRTTLEGDRMLVAVVDRGVGISDADFDRLYEPFFSTKRHRVGLGLATALHVAKVHGGTLSADRNLECGMTFTASFPVRPMTDDENSRSANGLT